jgi:hypothetical protein
MAEGETMSKEIRTMRVKRTVALLVSSLALGLALAASAQAQEAVSSFSVTPSTAAAGAHPDIEMSFSLESPGAPESAQNVAVNTSEGVFGNPNATIRCTSADFSLDQCPSGSQIGLVTVHANSDSELLGTAPIFNLGATETEPALFGLVIPTIDVPVLIPVAVRTGSDYGLRFTVSNLTQLAPLASADLIFWGFPANSSHDGDRFPKGSPGDPAGCPGNTGGPNGGTGCIASPTAAAETVHPLTDNPSHCTGEPLSVSLDVTTYQDPDNPTRAEAAYPETTDCYNMVFKPVLQATPTSHETDSAAGLDIDLRSPQPLTEATTPSAIKQAILTLPEGLTINPDAADGQRACSDADANFGTESPAECPDNSKIGTFSVDSPALDGPLTGSIYIGQPLPEDQYRLFMAADGFGIHAKLVGAFRPDPVTGQVAVYLNDLPQVPFDDFQVHLFASDRGLMATPTACHVYPVEARFFPWNDVLPDQNSLQFFSLGEGPHGADCPGEVRPFHPRLTAGTSNPLAGAYSDFALQLDREDGDQFLGDVNFRMPPGFTGDLRGISYCQETSIQAAAAKLGEDERANPSCPESSQIGTTNVAAGPGDHPFHAVGKMYLAGPFKGAPLSLAAITPALAGPYDYGTVVVRVALHVDPYTAQVSAVSDTVPSIIGGIPIRLRSIRVHIDRPSFTINPTNCSLMSVDSEGIGDQGTVAQFSSYFHAVNCLALPFKPKMAIHQLGGHKRTRRDANPALQFDLITRPGDANIRSLAVTLPNAFEIDQNHLGNLCTEKELAATKCAGRQAIGEATTVTPLLDEPLHGLVYAVSGLGGLPRLAFVLGGQVDLLPRAETISLNGGRLKTTVPVVPDAAIGHFHLLIYGGKHGYLANTRSLCAHASRVQIEYKGQNGVKRKQRVGVKTPCGKGSARHKHHRR